MEVPAHAARGQAPAVKRHQVPQRLDGVVGACAAPAGRSASCGGVGRGADLDAVRPDCHLVRFGAGDARVASNPDRRRGTGAGGHARAHAVPREIPCELSEGQGVARRCARERDRLGEAKDAARGCTPFHRDQKVGSKHQPIPNLEKHDRCYCTGPSRRPLTLVHGEVAALDGQRKHARPRIGNMLSPRRGPTTTGTSESSPARSGHGTPTHNLNGASALSLLTWGVALAACPPVLVARACRMVWKPRRVKHRGRRCRSHRIGAIPRGARCSLRSRGARRTPQKRERHRGDGTALLSRTERGFRPPE